MTASSLATIEADPRSLVGLQWEDGVPFPFEPEASEASEAVRWCKDDMSISLTPSPGVEPLEVDGTVVSGVKVKFLPVFA
jgi:hypothetical protein